MTRKQIDLKSIQNEQKIVPIFSYAPKLQSKLDFIRFFYQKRIKLLKLHQTTELSAANRCIDSIPIHYNVFFLSNEFLEKYYDPKDQTLQVAK